MGNNLSVTIVSSEVEPYAKTGGLADVVGSLPIALKNAGVDVRIVMPRYRVIDIDKYHLKKEQILEVPISSRLEPCTVYSAVHNNNIPIYFIDQPSYFDRDELYCSKSGDYPDNAERFIFFMRAVLELLIAMNLKTDIIHTNDWQTALIPVYLKTLYRDEPFYKKTASVFTIHNLAFQGIFWHYDLHYTGLQWDIFTYDKLEFYGKLNFLKGAIVFSDIINTVSKTYANEIQTPNRGCGLDTLLKYHHNKLYGIINAIDTEKWNPENDPYLTEKYSINNLEGKTKCKEFLLNKLGLKDKSLPLLGLIGRLTEQKGIDLVLESLPVFLENDKIQFVLLGTGEIKYHELFRKLKQRFPDNVSINLGFNKEMAHLIEGGADIYLMPSLFEPCGLNQLMSLRYGTVPIVRLTGGLADTVSEYSGELANGNGFFFKEPKPSALQGAITKALNYYHQPDKWKQIITNGMKGDYSWKLSALNYIKLYNKALSQI